MCHELRSYFQEKIPKKVFQIGSVILMAQVTNQKKTELIDYFDLVWAKNLQF